MTQQERDLLQKIDPEGKTYVACRLEMVDPGFRYFYVWKDHTGRKESARIVLLDNNNETTIRELGEFDSKLYLTTLGNECEQLVATFASLGYKDISEDEPLAVCDITDARVFYYWDTNVPSPLCDGHFVTMSLAVERTCHPTTEKELEEVAAHFKELRDKAVRFSAAFDGAENARLVHVSTEPYFSLTTNELGTIPELYIGFTSLDDPILVHEAQIDDIIDVDAEDTVENHLIYFILVLMG